MLMIVILIYILVFNCYRRPVSCLIPLFHMFVCLCKSVTDHEIRDAVDGGVSSFEAMQEHLAVATVCGSCSCEVKQIMQKKIQIELSSRSFPAAAAANPTFA